MNHQERLAAAGYYERRNGVSHAELTKPAHNHLTRLLRGYGNRLSAPHETALYALVGSMTEMAQGKLKGRWAFGLPTGMGKTKSIEAWLYALHEAGADGISVAVAASKVEALCSMKRNLLAMGVPAEKVGLVHTKLYDPRKAAAVRAGSPESDRYASEPSEGADRQIVLVTHQRIRGSSLSTFHYRNGKPRDLLIYDESLLVSDAFSISVPLLKGALGWLEGAHSCTPEFAPVIAYVAACVAAIEEELKAQKEGRSRGVISLPEVPPESLPGFTAQLSRSPALEPARQLLDISTEQVRVLPTGQGGVVWYQVSVPSEIENILVLDASQPIRRLVHLDPTIKDAETELPQMRRVGVPLSKLKTFGSMTVHQMFAGGGRSTMEASFRQQYAEDRKAVREVVEVVKNVPPDQAVLIFTYKTRPGEKVDYKGVLMRDLERAGVDVNATIATAQGPRPRVNVLTWGQETSLNEYEHCSHVLLAGVLQRSSIDLAASYLGQLDTLSGDVPSTTLADLKRSEICHMIYQALSRGACRVVDNGRAGAMHAYLIHRDDRIKGDLDMVMPGAKWVEWRPQFFKPTVGTMAALSRRIKEHLEQLPEEVETISTRKLKEQLDAKTVPSMTWTDALRRCLADGVPWLLQGRSLTRGSAVFAD